MAATRETASEGALLLAVYAAGLGVPFLVSGLALARPSGVFGWVKRRATAITLASACCSRRSASCSSRTS